MRSPNLQTTLLVAVIILLIAPFSFAQYAISTVAGGGPNNLAELGASIGYPGSIAFDAAGNTYLADSYSSHIFEVSATTGILTVVAGNGTHGYSGDGGPATSAALNGPEGVFVDGSGNIFIADTNNCLIREVSGGNISTVAGNSSLLDPCGYAGDGGPATSAQLYDPFGIFVEGSGSSESIFIADTDNCLIREVSGGTISTVAGNPLASPTPCGYSGDGGAATSAQLDEPFGVFVDGAGNIFIADTYNNLIRIVNTGAAPITIAGVSIPATYIETVAGAYYESYGGTACLDAGDGGVATSADLCAPDGVFVDSSENIYIADTNNFAIREVAASTTNIITTLVGVLGVEGYSANGTAATAADLNYPSNTIVDGTGDIFIADTDNFVIREVTASNNEIQTAIGNNTEAYSGDGGTPLNAELNDPASVFVDGPGDIFIADAANSVVREVVAASGDIQTVAGNGTACALASPPVPPLCGDGGAATSAQLNSPEAVFVDALGNIYIADAGDNLIRVVNTGTATITIANVSVAAGAIETVAGSGTAGYLGDAGQAISAELNGPFGVFVDSGENIFIADTSNSVIREVTGSSGVINTVVGNGTECVTLPCGDGGPAASAQLNFPTGVFVDLSEDIFVADTSDNAIREVTASNGTIQTVAGTLGTAGYAGDGAAATSANLDDPYAVFVDLSGDIFIADTDNAAIREVAAATGFIQTVAGIAPAVAGGLPTPGFSGDGGQATSAELNSPSSVFGNSAGNLFVADTDNQRIRELVPAIFVMVTPNPVNVAVSTQQQFTAAVTGTTNTAVTWQVNGVVGGNSTVGTISTTGLFQAPATIPTPATVTVTAISAADGTTSGSAQATIVSAGGAVAVTVSTNPPVTQVFTSTMQAFIATVTGTTDTAVTWQVNGTTGGNATVGTIDTSGNYTAPPSVPSPATVTIEAVSEAVSSAVGTESVTIVTAPSAADPEPQTISPGAQANYTIVLNANTGVPGQPITVSCSQATLPPGATCAFFSQAGSSITTITPGPQAVQFSLTISVPAGSALASAEYPKSMQLAIYLPFMPLAGIFVVGVGLRDKRRRWLAVSGFFVFLILLSACGGNSKSTPTNPELGSYNVKVQGTTSAQPNPVTITVAGLIVQ